MMSNEQPNEQVRHDDQAIALPSRARTYYVIGLLTLIYMLNFVDRQIVNILAEPIKRDLHLADWQLGALTGLGFAFLYAVLGIPMARLAERYHRGWLISACLVVWSGFTVVCGMAANFTQILGARIGVGVGEAGCTPTAQSLIADIVPPEKRSSALGFFSLGVPVGSLFGLVLGGVIADSYGWRTAFLVAGVPGILLALLSFVTLSDPRPQASRASREVPSLRTVFGQLKMLPEFWYLGAGAGLSAFVGYGQQAFYASFFLRNYESELLGVGMSLGVGGALAFLGIALGIVLGVSGGAGTLVGGLLGDRASRRGRHGPAMVAAWSMLLAGPSLAAIFFLNDALVILGCLALPLFLKNMYFGPVFASVHGMISGRARATATAIFLFVLNMGGLGLGALLTGATSDLFASHFGPAIGVRYALVTSSLVCILSAACFWRASILIRRRQQAEVSI